MRLIAFLLLFFSFNLSFAGSGCTELEPLKKKKNKEYLTKCLLEHTNGNSKASYILSQYYLHGKRKIRDKNKGFNYLSVSAELGNSKAMFELGKGFVFGVFEKDVKKGIEFLEKASFLGNSDASIFLGDLYFDGFFVEKDIEKSLEFYRKTDSNYSLFKIGLILIEKGFEEDAFTIIEKSAKNGYAGALYQAGLMLENGIGTVKDLSKSKLYLKESCKMGYIVSCY